MHLEYEDIWSDNPVGHIAQEIECYDDSNLADKMMQSFNWSTARRSGYDTEEIASMAADGFEVP